MRVIAGRLGGRQFNSPGGNRTHPMSDKIRGALFNALGDIEGLTILDAFAGSGAISIEAISRGAKHATAIDIDKAAITTIVNNTEALGIADHIKAIRAGAARWLETSDSKDDFDIVVCDPQYDNPQLGVVARLAERVMPGGLLVCSLPPNAALQLSGEFTCVSSKNYNDAELWFYRRTKA